ncbi:MAG: adenosylcobinamide-GDP ribazoletransferase [archaeon]|nr:adenosylcobinamide-GDP ribazoletransferase [archaeon]
MKYEPSIFVALKGLFSFFTILPINIEKKHIDEMNKRFWLIPIIGLYYGMFAATIFTLCCEYISKIIAATLTLLLIGVMNRFLHFDGVVDFGDGLIVAGKREDHIRALKDTVIGAGGMATGLMVTLLAFSEYVFLSSISFLFFGISTEILIKNAQVSAAAIGTPGDGMAGDSVKFTTKKSLVLSSIVTIILLTFVYSVAKFIGVEFFNESIENAYLIGIVVGFFASICWGFFMSYIAEKNFGIVNGDVLGAVNETARVVVLFCMIVTLSVMRL